MGKLALILCFILSVFPADANKNWEEFNQMIDDVFAGKKIRIKTIK